MDLSSLTPEQRTQVEEKLKSMSPEEIAALQAQQSIFRQIVSGKIPSKQVYDDDKCMAILDIKPASKGHMLLLSKQYYAIMPQVPNEELGHLLSVSKRLSLAALKGARATGSTFFVANGAAAGQRVQDFMMHIIPRREGDKLFQYNKQLIGLEKRRALRNLIAAKISQLTGKPDPQPDEESEASDDVSTSQNSQEKNEDSNEQDSENELKNEHLEEDDDQENESEEIQDENIQSKREVNLDDIANLF